MSGFFSSAAGSRYGKADIQSISLSTVVSERSTLYVHPSANEVQYLEILVLKLRRLFSLSRINPNPYAFIFDVQDNVLVVLLRRIQAIT